VPCCGAHPPPQCAPKSIGWRGTNLVLLAHTAPSRDLSQVVWDTKKHPSCCSLDHRTLLCHDRGSRLMLRYATIMMVPA
jgi:hypothetical protein